MKMKNKNEIKDKSIGFDNRQSFGLHEIMSRDFDEDGNWSYYEPIDELKLFWNDFLTKELGCYEDDNWNDDLVLCDGFMKEEITTLLKNNVRQKFEFFLQDKLDTPNTLHHWSLLEHNRFFDMDDEELVTKEIN
jgi:hypothetical protein